MIHSFKDEHKRAGNRLLFFAGLVVSLFLFFTTGGYAYKLRQANCALQAQWNVQELRIDSLMAVKLLVDKELAHTKAALESAKAENLQLQAAITKAKASHALPQHTLEKLLQKKANKNNPVNKQPEDDIHKLLQQSGIQLSPAGNYTYLPETPTDLYEHSITGLQTRNYSGMR